MSAFDEKKVVMDEVLEVDDAILRDAQAADAKEHTMTLADGWRSHKKAILWSMALSGALIMEGYDVVVIGAFYGHPMFLKRFGEPAPTTEIGYTIPAEWQSALSNGSAAGGIIGLLINGWAADRFGPKIVMLTATVALTGFIFILVFGNSLQMLVIGEVFCGIPWGIFQTITTAYASEVCPIQLRGYLTAYVNLCWGVGILLSGGVVKATIGMTTDWAWRLPFVIQWVWVVPLFLIVWFSPMSPWFLVRKGRLAEAEAALRSLTNPAYVSETDIQNSVAMMVHTNELEKQVQAGTSYVECFRGVDRRRTEVTCMVFAMQQLSGQSLAGQAVQFLGRAGLSTAMVFNLNMVVNAMFIIGTFVSWGLLSVMGRRSIYIMGMGVMATTLFLIGGLGFVKHSSAGFGTTSYAIGGLLIALNFFYNATLGPVCYTLIGEMSSTRLRQKSIALSRISYQIMNIVGGIINPRMLGVNSWNLGPKSGLVWGVSAALSTAYCWFRLPETRGRSYGELDILFHQRVPAWKFKGTKVDQFGTAGAHALDKEEVHHLEHR